MPLRRLLIVISCSLLWCAPTCNLSAQISLREVLPKPASEFVPRTPTLWYALAMPRIDDVRSFTRRFTTTLSLALAGWPGLSSSTQAVLSQESLLERAFAPLQGPSMQLWGRLPEGGLVRWIGTRMEYDAPMWEIR